VLATVPEQPATLGKWAWAGIAVGGLVALLFFRGIVGARVERLRKRPARVWVDRGEARVGTTTDAYVMGDRVQVKVPAGSSDRDPLTGPEWHAFQVRIRRVPLAIKTTVGLVVVVGAVIWFVNWPGPAHPATLMTPATGQAPPPVPVALPQNPPHQVTSVTRPPKTPGTCFGGVIPDTGVVTAASGVSVVDCASPDAHYRSIESFYGTTDMSRCDAVPETQYTYSVTWTRGGVPISSTVHCLIGLGPYAR
jgi:hypothetical protein